MHDCVNLNMASLKTSVPALTAFPAMPRSSVAPSILTTKLIVYGLSLRGLEQRPLSLHTFKHRILLGLRQALPPAICMWITSLRPGPIQLEVISLFRYIVDADRTVRAVNASSAALAELIAAHIRGIPDVSPAAKQLVSVSVIGTSIINKPEERRACLEWALYDTRNQDSVELWNGLGILGGGKVRGGTYSAQECLQRCSDLLSSAEERAHCAVPSVPAQQFQDGLSPRWGALHDVEQLADSDVGTPPEQKAVLGTSVHYRQNSAKAERDCTAACHAKAKSQFHGHQLAAERTSSAQTSPLRLPILRRRSHC